MVPYNRDFLLENREGKKAKGYGEGAVGDVMIPYDLVIGRRYVYIGMYGSIRIY